VEVASGNQYLLIPAGRCRSCHHHLVPYCQPLNLRDCCACRSHAPMQSATSCMTDWAQPAAWLWLECVWAGCMCALPYRTKMMRGDYNGRPSYRHQSGHWYLPGTHQCQQQVGSAPLVAHEAVRGHSRCTSQQESLSSGSTTWSRHHRVDLPGLGASNVLQEFITRGHAVGCCGCSSLAVVCGQS
jgi:hypothetical protein